MSFIKGKLGSIYVFKIGNKVSNSSILIAMCVETSPKPYFTSEQPWLILYYEKSQDYW